MWVLALFQPGMNVCTARRPAHLLGIGILGSTKIASSSSSGTES